MHPRGAESGCAHHESRDMTAAVSQSIRPDVSAAPADRTDRLRVKWRAACMGWPVNQSLYSMRAMLDTSRFDAIDDLTADELRQRLRALQALIASAPVPIAIAHDPDCRFISANLALATLLGVPLGRQHLADAGRPVRRRPIASSAMDGICPAERAADAVRRSRTARRSATRSRSSAATAPSPTCRTTSSRSTTRTARSMAASASASI